MSKNKIRTANALPANQQQTPNALTDFSADNRQAVVLPGGNLSFQVMALKQLKTLLIIYAILTCLFLSATFLLNKLPPPYHKRVIPPEITPWLK